MSVRSANTRARRFGMWIAWRWFGGGSPSLAVLGLRPTLRWTWTGRSEHATATSSPRGDR